MTVGIRDIQPDDQQATEHQLQRAADQLLNQHSLLAMEEPGPTINGSACVNRMKFSFRNQSLELKHFSTRYALLPQETRNTREKEWPDRLLDGSRVTRENPARFCERPGVQFLRPTHNYVPGKSREESLTTIPFGLLLS